MALIAASTGGRRRAHWLGYLTLAPALVYVVGLIGVPVLLAISYSVSNTSIDNLNGKFVGLQNFEQLLSDPTFLQSLRNTMIYGGLSTILTAIFGTVMAFVLAEHFRGRSLLRFFMLLPWTIPVALGILSWLWIFDSQYSVVNWVALRLHLMGQPEINWRGQPVPAMIAVLAANVWHNMPFGAIILLAGLTSIPQDIIEAAKVDGAGYLRRFHYVLVPMMAPILFIGLIFNMVFNFTDLTVVYLLTSGGPANSTQVLSTYAFEVGIASGDLAKGAAITLFLLPLLLVVTILLLRQLKRMEV